jgi:hypothetical protein
MEMGIVVKIHVPIQVRERRFGQRIRKIKSSLSFRKETCSEDRKVHNRIW